MHYVYPKSYIVSRIFVIPLIQKAKYWRDYDYLSTKKHLFVKLFPLAIKPESKQYDADTVLLLYLLKKEK